MYSIFIQAFGHELTQALTRVRFPSQVLGKSKRRLRLTSFSQAFFSQAAEDFPLSLAGIFCSSDNKNCLSASLLLGQYGAMQSL